VILLNLSLPVRWRRGSVVALDAELAVKRVLVTIGSRCDPEASTELADEMRNAPVPDLLRDADHREVSVDQQLPSLIEAHLLHE
jgi:hypothetical protein